MSTYDTPHHIRRSIKVGASGYVIKDDASRDLGPAVRILYQGKRYFSQKIAELAKLYLEEKAK
jgi:DNA-binding NarL/FixJ family response regulator